MRKSLGVMAGVSVIVVVVIVVFVLSVAPRFQCTKERYLEKVTPLLERWDDAHAVASSTARIALGVQVNELVAIKQAMAQLDVPSCGEEVQKLLIEYMDATVESFLAFMAQESDEAVTDLVEKADGLLDDWVAAVGSLE